MIGGAIEKKTSSVNVSEMNSLISQNSLSTKQKFGDSRVFSRSGGVGSTSEDFQDGENLRGIGTPSDDLRQRLEKARPVVRPIGLRNLGHNAGSNITNDGIFGS